MHSRDLRREEKSRSSRARASLDRTKIYRRAKKESGGEGRGGGSRGSHCHVGVVDGGVGEAAKEAVFRGLAEELRDPDARYIAATNGLRGNY